MPARSRSKSPARADSPARARKTINPVVILDGIIKRNDADALTKFADKHIELLTKPVEFPVRDTAHHAP